MSSLWKDLLFLHGYLVRKEDLRWREQVSVEATTEPVPAEAAVDRAGTAPGQSAKTTGDMAPKKCPSHWPRLAAPH